MELAAVALLTALVLLAAASITSIRRAESDRAEILERLRRYAWREQP